MNILIGYNFFEDINAIDPFCVSVANITNTQISNGIFNHLNITKNINENYTSYPPNWDFDTIMDANFNGNINAGNLGQLSKEITEIKIKRRVVGEYDWTTIQIIPINSYEDLSFTINDNLNLNNMEYEYAFVPISNGIEGNYITQTIYSQFDGIFICDINTIYKFYYGVEYGSNDRVQQVGVLEPYGQKYPIIISNSLINYETGSIKGSILPDDFGKTSNNIINREAISLKKKNLFDFLTNGKPKIIKDWNQNQWLVFITSNPSASFNNNVGMGLVDVEFEWTEVGDINNKLDLYNNGLIPTGE